MNLTPIDPGQQSIAFSPGLNRVDLSVMVINLIFPGYIQCKLM